LLRYPGSGALLLAGEEAMKAYAFAAAVLICSCSIADAKCDRYGNCYNTYGSGYSGYNLNNGTSWNSRSSGSSTFGTDSRGNSWNHNRNSGSYYNYGTGEYRYWGNRF
jgi:hypothetical protein